MAANPLALDIRGLLNVDAQLALLDLQPQFRRQSGQADGPGG